MKRYSRVELVAFLRRLDALLTERAVLEVVGGAAAVLKYGARAPTKDIDTWNRVPKAVQDAADTVAAMGHGVPLAPAGVAEIPNDAELRFKTVSIGLKKVSVRRIPSLTTAGAGATWLVDGYRASRGLSA